MGSKFALTVLSLAYSTGEWGIPKDELKAARLLAKAADLGDIPALSALGYAYQNGLGVTQDFTKALTLYRAAAKRGGLDAMIVMYYSGIGVKKDMPTAVYWYKTAADAGFHPGMNLLASMYETGQGTDQNLDEAKRLYKLLEAEGDPAAAVELQRIAVIVQRLAAGPHGYTTIDLSNIRGLNSNFQSITLNDLLTSTPTSIAGHTIDVVTVGGTTTVYGNSGASGIPIGVNNKDLHIVHLNGVPPINLILNH